MNDFNDDKHLDVCMAIEAGLKRHYESIPGLTDAQCIFALENARTAVRKEFGFAKNERVINNDVTAAVIECCTALALERVGKVNDLTLDEYLARIEKVKRSVKRHSAYGERSYYEFIRAFLP